MILINASMIFVYVIDRCYWILRYDTASYPGMRDVIQGRCVVRLSVTTIGGGILNITLRLLLSFGCLNNGAIG